MEFDIAIQCGSNFPFGAEHFGAFDSWTRHLDSSVSTQDNLQANDGTLDLYLICARFVTEIYADIVRRHIEQSDKLNILSQVGHGKWRRRSESLHGVPR